MKYTYLNTNYVHKILHTQSRRLGHVVLKKFPFVFSVSNVGFCARADLLHIFTLVGISGADSSTANLIAFFGSTTSNHKVFNHKKDNR